MKAYSIVGIVFSILFILFSFFLLDMYEGTGNPTGVIVFGLSLFALTVSIISLVKAIKKEKELTKKS